MIFAPSHTQPLPLRNGLLENQLCKLSRVPAVSKGETPAEIDFSTFEPQKRF